MKNEFPWILISGQYRIDRSKKLKLPKNSDLRKDKNRFNIGFLGK